MPAISAMENLVPSRSLFAPVADALVALGDWAAFSLRTLSGLTSRHFRRAELVTVCTSVGVNSLAVVAITGTFIGMVLAVQAYGQFRQIGNETSLGAAIHLSVIRELGPVLTAVMLAGRVGSAMAAQLGTMKVTEQLDALACLGVEPIRFLVAPRFVACLVMIPLLTVFADLMGMFGSSAICLKVFHIEPYHYWEHTRAFVHIWDVGVGLAKSVVFGGIVALVSCHRGFRASAGAEGVGRAATQAFVVSFVAILAADFVLGLFGNAVHDMIWPPTGLTRMA
ncbi:MAG TPA: ABC transporter permease [Fimbriiglobus sp.]|jgi:phospholipid/cholesterol/gamma-HCH transport system permease protein